MLLVTISRCSAFMLQLLSMNCTASQSKSAESVGGFPFFPKLTTVGTSGFPKWRSQIWFTATRAVSGFCLLAIQLARAVRRPELVFG